MLTSLKGLLVSNNGLGGSIPQNIAAWTTLRMLWLDSNRLTGSLAFLTNLTDLVSAQLGKNRFQGRIPTEIGTLVNITGFMINDNELTGRIPTEIGNLVQLTDLWLYGNQLSGQRGS